jgi:hypothetical protein
MEKEFIPYEQALALKELGFDEPCFTKFEDYFHKTKLHPILVTLSLNGPYEYEYNGYEQKIINDDTKRWFFTGYKNSVKDHNNDILSAPTYQQAFRWFREKYELSGNIDCCDKLCEWNIKSSKLEKSIFSSKIQSYEEAELACLKKLIEIVKQIIIWEN